MFNVLLVFGVLIALYYCIQKHKKENEKTNTSQEEKIKFVENFQMDKIKYNEPVKTNTVKFDYAVRPIEQQFMMEQKQGVTMMPAYPNRWIESFDSAGNPVYNSRENVTGVIETFIEPKARFTYDFNKEKTITMDGIADPDDFINGQGKTLREVYDNSFVDFKKLVPKEKVISSEPNTNFAKAASSLYYLTPDTWVYENEKPENGGESLDGILASDPASYGSVAAF